MLVALLKVMELTCLEKLVPSAEISPGTWLGLGQENEAGFAVGPAAPLVPDQDMSRCHSATTISWWAPPCPGAEGRRCYWGLEQHKR